MKIQRSRGTYFVVALILFIIEVLIALYINDAFIRPYLGDVLVIWLLYAMIQSVLNSVYRIAIIVCILAFSFIVEIAQFYNLVELLQLKDNQIAHIILGTSFS